MTPGQAAFIGYMDVMSGPNPIGHGYPASEKVMEAWEAAADAVAAWYAARDAARNQIGTLVVPVDPVMRRELEDFLAAKP